MEERVTKSRTILPQAPISAPDIDRFFPSHRLHLFLLTQPSYLRSQATGCISLIHRFLSTAYYLEPRSVFQSHQ